MSLIHVSVTFGQRILTIFVIFRRRDRDYQSWLELVRLVPSLKDRFTDTNIDSTEVYCAQVR